MTVGSFTQCTESGALECRGVVKCGLIKRKRPPKGALPGREGGPCCLRERVASEGLPCRGGAGDGGLRSYPCPSCPRSRWGCRTSLCFLSFLRCLGWGEAQPSEVVLDVFVQHGEPFGLPSDPVDALLNCCHGPGGCPTDGAPEPVTFWRQMKIVRFEVGEPFGFGILIHLCHSIRNRRRRQPLDERFQTISRGFLDAGGQVRILRIPPFAQPRPFGSSLRLSRATDPR